MKKLMGIAFIMMLVFTSGCSANQEKSEEEIIKEEQTRNIDRTKFEDKQTEKMNDMSENGWELSYEIDKDTAFGTLYLKKDNLRFMYGNIGTDESVSFEDLENKKITLCFKNFLIDSIPENAVANPLASQGTYIYIPSASKNGEESLFSDTNPVNNFHDLEAQINPIEEVTADFIKEIVEQKLALTRSNIESYKSEIQESVKVLDASLKEINCKDIEEVNTLMHNYFIALNK